MQGQSEDTLQPHHHTGAHGEDYAARVGELRNNEARVARLLVWPGLPTQGSERIDSALL